MASIYNLKKLSFLVYGLGLTGQSVISFFKKNNIENYQAWDDKNKKLFKKKGHGISKSHEGSQLYYIKPRGKLKKIS